MHLIFAITANLTFAEQGVAAWGRFTNSLVARRSEFVSKSGLFRERAFQYVLGQQNTRHVNGQLTLQHETVLVETTAIGSPNTPHELTVVAMFCSSGNPNSGP